MEGTTRREHVGVAGAQRLRLDRACRDLNRLLDEPGQGDDVALKISPDSRHCAQCSRAAKDGGTVAEVVIATTSYPKHSTFIDPNSRHALFLTEAVQRSADCLCEALSGKKKVAAFLTPLRLAREAAHRGRLGARWWCRALMAAKCADARSASARCSRRIAIAVAVQARAHIATA